MFAHHAVPSVHSRNAKFSQCHSLLGILLVSECTGMKGLAPCPSARIAVLKIFTNRLLTLGMYALGNIETYNNGWFFPKETRLASRKYITQ